MTTETLEPRVLLPNHVRQLLLAEAIATWEAQEYRVVARTATSAVLERRKIYRLSTLFLAGAVTLGLGAVGYVLWVRRRHEPRVFLEVDRYGHVRTRQEP